MNWMRGYFTSTSLLLEVPAAEVSPVEGDLAQVRTVVELGVQETPDPLATFIDETEEFTVIDGFIELCALAGRRLVDVLVRIAAERGVDLCPPAQSLDHCRAVVILVIIEPTAGPA